MSKLNWDDMSPRERKLYINQDHVNKKRLEVYLDQQIIDKGNYDAFPDPIRVKSPSHLKDLIIQLHLDGKNNLEIAYHLPCSIQYIRRVLLEYTNILGN